MTNQQNIVELTIVFDDKSYSINVPETLASEAQEFFDKMDMDMNAGWQMSRWWVPDPDQTQRCQIVADKLLTAMTNNDEKFAQLMCAYILKSKPATKRIQINTDGEIQGNEFLEI
ncbi:MAG: hypothetical protein ACERLB_12440 [Gammaproteobacteria bacterium]